MEVIKKDSQKTRQRLLEAACDLFAEKGYREATIAEICERAGANIASVNYHFRDKATLYREAWRNAFIESLRAHPPDGGIRPDATAEDRFRGFIVSFIQRISDENNKEFPIVYRELANPTGLLKEVMEEEIGPILENIELVIRELLGKNASDREIKFTVISIISQCITPMLAQRFKKEIKETKGRFPEIDDIDAYAEHVVKFSLAAIKKAREELEKKRAKKVSKGVLL